MKLLIAEDEPLCLSDLKELDWTSQGIDSIITAENGEDAYNLALAEKPDIIMSDIKMPRMNGLELAEKVSVVLPESRFIILTAYNSFSYAQTAISTGVFSYILKPFIADDIYSAVSKAAASVREQKLQLSRATRLTQRLEVSKHFLLGYFFNVFEGKNLNSNALSEVFGITETDNVYTAMVVSLDYTNDTNTFDRNYRIFNNLIKIFAGYDNRILSFFDTTQLVFFFASDAAASPQSARSNILVCADSAESYLNFNYSDKYVIGIGNSLRGIEKCKLSYNGAIDAVKYSFYLGFNTVICISDFESSETIDDYYEFSKDEFFGNVKVGDFESAKFVLEKLFNNFRTNQTDIEVVQRICHEILVHLALCLMQCKQDPSLIFNKSNIWDVLKQYKSVNDIETFILGFIDVVISNINYRNDQKSYNLTNDIKKYISEHPATSLTEIAEHFFHSPNYLSTMFSKETGMTIRNYMIEARINHAKKLLTETNESIGTIAVKVGYKTTQHFSTIFSKHTGVTPGMYRATAKSDS